MAQKTALGLRCLAWRSDRVCSLWVTILTDSFTVSGARLNLSMVPFRPFLDESSMIRMSVVWRSEMGSMGAEKAQVGKCP